MKAAIKDRYGTPDVVRIEEIERPTAGEGEILVRVKAASVNRADLDGIEPRPAFVRLFIGLRAPRMRSIGIDVAGIVEAVGTGVTRFRPGDAVFADLFGQRYGSFAEYAVASRWNRRQRRELVHRRDDLVAALREQAQAARTAPHPVEPDPETMPDLERHR